MTSGLSAPEPSCSALRSCETSTCTASDLDSGSCSPQSSSRSRSVEGLRSDAGGGGPGARAACFLRGRAPVCDRDFNRSEDAVVHRCVERNTVSEGLYQALCRIRTARCRARAGLSPATSMLARGSRRKKLEMTNWITGVAAVRAAGGAAGDGCLGRVRLGRCWKWRVSDGHADRQRGARRETE
jgi:hypothetical protein